MTGPHLVDGPSPRTQRKRETGAVITDHQTVSGMTPRYCAIISKQTCDRGAWLRIAHFAFAHPHRFYHTFEDITLGPFNPFEKKVVGEALGDPRSLRGLAKLQAHQSTIKNAKTSTRNNDETCIHTLRTSNVIIDPAPGCSHIRLVHIHSRMTRWLHTHTRWAYHAVPSRGEHPYPPGIV